MKKIFENNHIIITIAEEVVKDFEYLEDFFSDYCKGYYQDVKTLEELQEAIGWEGVELEYIDNSTPIYYYDIKKQFRNLVDTAEIYDVIEYIKNCHGDLSLVIDLEDFDIMDFKTKILYMNIERIFYNELAIFYKLAQIENK